MLNRDAIGQRIKLENETFDKASSLIQRLLNVSGAMMINIYSKKYPIIFRDLTPSLQDLRSYEAILKRNNINAVIVDAHYIVQNVYKAPDELYVTDTPEEIIRKLEYPNSTVLVNAVLQSKAPAQSTPKLVERESGIDNSERTRVERERDKTLLKVLLSFYVDRLAMHKERVDAWLQFAIVRAYKTSTELLTMLTNSFAGSASPSSADLAELANDLCMINMYATMDRVQLGFQSTINYRPQDVLTLVRETVVSMIAEISNQNNIPADITPPKNAA